MGGLELGRPGEKEACLRLHIGVMWEWFGPVQCGYDPGACWRTSSWVTLLFHDTQRLSQAFWQRT